MRIVAVLAAIIPALASAQGVARHFSPPLAPVAPAIYSDPAPAAMQAFGAAGCIPSGSISIVRAGTRTCNVGGTVVTCQANEACVEAAGLDPETWSTNVLLRSADMTTSPWDLTRCQIASDAAAAPDGTTSAEKVYYLAAGGGTVQQRLRQSISTTNGAKYTMSVYAKRGELSKFALREGAATGAYVAVNLATGAVLASGNGATNATITPVAGLADWYRVAATFTASTTSYVDLYLLPNSYTSGDPGTVTVTGDGASGVYAWGAQLERLGRASPLIPTTTTTASRAADVVTVPWTIPLGGNWCVRTTAQPSDSRAWTAVGTALWEIGADGGANSARIQATTGGALVLDVYDGSGAVKTLSYTHGFTAGTSHTVTACVAAGTLSLRVDAADVSGTVTGAGSATWSASPATIYLGSLSTTGAEAGGNLSGLRICRSLARCL